MTLLMLRSQSEGASESTSPGLQAQADVIGAFYVKAGGSIISWNTGFSDAVRRPRFQRRLRWTHFRTWLTEIRLLSLTRSLPREAAFACLARTKSFKKSFNSVHGRDLLSTSGGKCARFLDFSKSSPTLAYLRKCLAIPISFILLRFETFYDWSRLLINLIY